MKARFAETFYFLALVSSHDRWHDKAVQLSRTLICPIFTTTWVLTELADAMCRPPRRERFRLLFDRLRSEPRTIIVPATDDLFESGLDLYFNRSDKEWSLTDRISFVVMRREGLIEALTAGHHFEQAGFVALLKQ